MKASKMLKISVKKKKKKKQNLFKKIIEKKNKTNTDQCHLRLVSTIQSEHKISNPTIKSITCEKFLGKKIDNKLTLFWGV